MKAAVIYDKQGLPEYTDHADPVVNNEDEVLLTMKAVAVKHIDKSRASGAHYSSSEKTGAGTVPGSDGVGILPDGTRVYAVGSRGMMAERAIADKHYIVKLPDALDDIAAAALPNAVIGSAMGLKYRANMQPGDTVLINGATGVTGKIAVQVAKHYGACKVIVTGRNKETLNTLKALGADELILLEQDDEALLAKIKVLHASSPINVVIDYLWGRSAETILSALKGNGRFTPRTRFVSIGAMTGDTIQLSAANLRCADVQLSGSGLGSWTKEQLHELFTAILPEMFELAATDKLQIDTIEIDIKNIAKLADMNIPGGKRVVVKI